MVKYKREVKKFNLIVLMYPVVKVNSRIKVGQKSDIIEIENSIK